MSKEKVLPYDAIALGRWAGDIFQQTTGGEVALWIVFKVQGWHGLTFYFYPIWITSWDLPSLPSLQGAQGNKIINSVSSISHILTRGGGPDHQRISCTGSGGRMRGDMLGASFFCSAILYDTIGWHGGGLTSSCMIQDTTVKFEDPRNKWMKQRTFSTIVLVENDWTNFWEL